MPFDSVWSLLCMTSYTGFSSQHNYYVTSKLSVTVRRLITKDLPYHLWNVSTILKNNGTVQCVTCEESHMLKLGRWTLCFTVHISSSMTCRLLTIFIWSSYLLVLLHVFSIGCAFVHGTALKIFFTGTLSCEVMKMYISVRCFLREFYFGVGV